MPRGLVQLPIGEHDQATRVVRAIALVSHRRSPAGQLQEMIFRSAPGRVDRTTIVLDRKRQPGILNRERQCHQTRHGTGAISDPARLRAEAECQAIDAGPRLDPQFVNKLAE